MSPNQPPIPKNEFDRILSLSEFDLDYTDLEKHFKDLTKLAAKVSGTEISLINLIDSFTQWSVSGYGIGTGQTPREESVCQYTLMENEYFEVKDLRIDHRFESRIYMEGDKRLVYYLGVPLTTTEGHNLGALCVLDNDVRELSQEKIELLKIIADEIVNRLKIMKAVNELKNKMLEIKQNQKKVAHDIRGPIGGIIGLAKIIQDQGKDNQLDEVLDFINLIQKSGSSVLELADEILSQDYPKQQVAAQEINHSIAYSLETLKQKLIDMFGAQAKHKKIRFSVSNAEGMEDVPFPKNKLLQIIGNLISNALKFTQENGEVSVALDINEQSEDKRFLVVKVKDSGIGISQKRIEEILDGQAKSTGGTSGEQGYGFGLALVKHLVDKASGTMSIESKDNQGTYFSISLPI
ncbi:GAF domain-containing sensor histidine kinase [Belliella sp. DSM 111904]|uniref:histidine kinase n=1 Tax=Belliella filtrata TaxID=2923435 RepID=A0ABS9UYR3_9BACT|nr:GAF domain-containing sensor histidine kinase [Belliella filtrata]MCH7409304.1 GAF domain-containing sensor histidine kinase [Belliella filtrata]